QRIMKLATRTILSAVLVAAVSHITVHGQKSGGSLPESAASAQSSNQLPAVSLDQLSTEPQDLSTLGQNNAALAAAPAAVGADTDTEGGATAAVAAALPIPTAKLSANSTSSSAGAANAMPTTASDAQACSMDRNSQAYQCYMKGRSITNPCDQYKAQMTCLESCPAGSQWDPVKNKLEEYYKKYCDPSASASDDDDKVSSTKSTSGCATKTLSGASPTSTGDDSSAGHLVVGSWSLVVGSAMAYFLI
ncbi:hypothetical protein H4R35_007016, partial [Dimargaris xerosporica]